MAIAHRDDSTDTHSLNGLVTEITRDDAVIWILKRLGATEI